MGCIVHGDNSVTEFCGEWHTEVDVVNLPCVKYESIQSII